VRIRQALVGVRVRVVVASVVLLAAALLTSTLVVRQVLYAQLDREIEDELAQEIEEVRALTSGNDPRTGMPFGADVAAVFETFLSRSVPARDEAFFTVLDGRPHLSTAAPPAQLLDDPALVAKWAAAAEPTREDVSSSAGEARTLAVPLRLEGATAGTFVVAIFPADRRDDIAEAVLVITVVGGIVLVISSFIAWSLAGRVLRPVAELTATARRITDTDLTARIPQTGDDELARLGGTFNDMLDRLEDAFGSQRAFLSDVAHELRTPITIVRGHLELLGDDPAEREETVSLVTDELDRMARYVDDLLLLAKAEQPDFLRPEAVDAGELALDLAARVRGLGERVWTLSACPDVGDCQIVADPARLSQAVANLAANAVQHTADGDEIHLSVRCRPDAVEFEVRDRGPGVDESVLATVFDRHRRGERSRERRPEGSGLGLAIVSAIAHAHGGLVSVASRPGEGAAFTISVPRKGRPG
jgi:two-component system OmpR family sensor kinase